MPIRVEHAPPSAILALTGLMSGQGKAAESELENRRQAGRLAVQLDARQIAQTQQLRQARDMQMEQIEAASDRQREAADIAFKRTALEAGLDKQLQDDEFEREIAKKQEEARIQAEQFEFEYTTKQRQEIARLNNADELVKNDPRFSEQDRQQWNVDYAQKLAGITPRARPRDPNKQTFKEGRAPGDEFQDKGGNWHMVQSDGSTKMTLRWDQGPEAAKMKYEAEQAKAELEIQIKEAAARQKRIDDVRKFRYDLSQKINEVTGQLYSGPEIDAGTMQRFGGRQVTEFREQDLPGQDRGPATPDMPRELIGWSRQMGIKTTEADTDLPELVGKAQAFMREMEILSKRGQDISRFNAPILEARAILKQYRAVIEGR
jgi:hypothetical protein